MSLSVGKIAESISKVVFSQETPKEKVFRKDDWLKFVPAVVLVAGGFIKYFISSAGGEAKLVDGAPSLGDAVKAEADLAIKQGDYKRAGELSEKAATLYLYEARYLWHLRGRQDPDLSRGHVDISGAAITAFRNASTEALRANGCFLHIGDNNAAYRMALLVQRIHKEQTLFMQRISPDIVPAGETNIRDILALEDDILDMERQWKLESPSARLEELSRKALRSGDASAIIAAKEFALNQALKIEKWLSSKSSQPPADPVEKALLAEASTRQGNMYEAAGDLSMALGKPNDAAVLYEHATESYSRALELDPWRQGRGAMVRIAEAKAGHFLQDFVGSDYGFLTEEVNAWMNRGYRIAQLQLRFMPEFGGFNPDALVRIGRYLAAEVPRDRGNIMDVIPLNKLLDALTDNKPSNPMGSSGANLKKMIIKRVALTSAVQYFESGSPIARRSFEDLSPREKERRIQMLADYISERALEKGDPPIEIMHDGPPQVSKKVLDDALWRYRERISSEPFGRGGLGVETKETRRVREESEEAERGRERPKKGPVRP